MTFISAYENGWQRVQIEKGSCKIQEAEIKAKFWI
jgi:hypothetical protein